MAANDYHIIVYQILEYLYTCLKDGQEVDLASIEKFKVQGCINEKYWQYILRHLCDSSLVEGLHKVPVLGGGVQLRCTHDFCITPAGIEYLMENSLMSRAKQVITDTLKVSAPSILSQILK